MEGEIIVAKKKTGIAVCFISFIIIGVILIALGAVMCSMSNSMKIEIMLILGGAGLVLAAIGAYVTVRYFQLPKALIVYRDGTLYMPKGLTCTPDELNHILVSVRSYCGVADKWGKLTLTINGVKHNINYVNKIQDAADLLSDIKSEYMQSIMEAEVQARAESISKNKSDGNVTEEKAVTEDEKDARIPQPEAADKPESGDPFGC